MRNDGEINLQCMRIENRMNLQCMRIDDERRMIMAKEKEKDEKVVVSIWVDKKTVKDLDYVADKGGLTRSKLLSNILEATAHDLMVLDKFGVVRMSAFFWDMRDALKNARSQFKNKFIMGTLMING
jgi:hypothetical protein